MSRSIIKIIFGVITTFTVVLGSGINETPALKHQPTVTGISTAGSNQPIVTDISIPLMLNYQGKLTDVTGNPVRDSLYSITFRIFNTASGGTEFWTETQPCSTHSGLFNCLLGSVTPIESLSSDGNCYLEMQVNPNPAMSPRVRIVSSAYSYLARKADSANYATNATITRPITPPIANEEISDNAVTSSKILDGSIRGVDIIAPCSLQATVLSPGAVLRVTNQGSGSGIIVDVAGDHGVRVGRVHTYGVLVDSASECAFCVYRAGLFGFRAYNVNNYGVLIDSAGEDAFRTYRAGYNGMSIYRAGQNGIWISRARFEGLIIDSSGDNGVEAYGNNSGGTFRANVETAKGVIAHAYQNSTTDTAIYAYGKVVATGGVSSVLTNGEGHSLVSTNPSIVAYGSGRIVDGNCNVLFERTFTENLAPNREIKIFITPSDIPAGLICVKEKSTNGFKAALLPIAELADYKSNLNFDWMAIGNLKEYETSSSAKAEWEEAIGEREARNEKH
jgi:hypothetical protein